MGIENIFGEIMIENLKFGERQVYKIQEAQLTPDIIISKKTMP